MANRSALYFLSIFESKIKPVLDRERCMPIPWAMVCSLRTDTYAKPRRSSSCGEIFRVPKVEHGDTQKATTIRRSSPPRKRRIHSPVLKPWVGGVGCEGHGQSWLCRLRLNRTQWGWRPSRVMPHRGPGHTASTVPTSQRSILAVLNSPYVGVGERSVATKFFLPTWCANIVAKLVFKVSMEKTVLTIWVCGRKVWALP